MEAEPNARPTATGGPDFMCIGAQKAGTQWLYDQLALHPQVWMPPIKEIHFFDRRVQIEKTLRTLAYAESRLDALNARRIRSFRPPLDARDIAFLRHIVSFDSKTSDIEWYAELFADKGDQISGDITPKYALLPIDRIEEIYSRFPCLKIVYLVRDPVERAWSAMSMYWRGKFNGDTADMPESPKVREFASNQSFIRHSRVTGVIEAWREVFPAAQFHVALFDDIKARPVEVVDDVLCFLNLARDARRSAPPNFNRKQGQRSVGMPDDIRAELVNALAGEVLSAARLLGGAASSWPAKYGLE